MSFQNNEDYNIEFFILEVASLMAIREGKEKKQCHLVILETLSEWIKYYELGLPAKKAYGLFWSSDGKT